MPGSFLRFIIGGFTIISLSVSAFAGEQELIEKRDAFVAGANSTELANILNNEWLNTTGKSKAVRNLRFYWEDNVIDNLDSSDKLGNFERDDDNYVEDMVLKFFWSSDEFADRSGIIVLCKANLRYNAGDIEISRCLYIEDQEQEMGIIEQLTTARENGKALVPIQDLAKSIASETSKTIKIKSFLGATTGRTNFCNPTRGTDFTVPIVTGSEKEDFLVAAAETFIGNRKNLIGNECFSISISSKGSVSGAKAVKSDTIAAKTRDGEVHPVIWTPASSFYMNYAFGNNAINSGKFKYNKPVVKSPMVVVYKKDSKKSDLELQLGKEDRSFGILEGYQGLVDVDFFEFPTILGLTEIVLRTGLKKKDPNKIKFGKRGRAYRMDTTKGNQSNSGFSFAALWSWERCASEAGLDLSDPIPDDVINSMDSCWNSDAFKAGLNEMVKATTKSKLRSTSFLAEEFKSSNAIRAAFVYENLGIHFYKNQPETFQFLYTYNNIESDHPAYILTKDSDSKQQQAAKEFLDFLRTKEMQMLAMTSFGFRPIQSTDFDEADKKQVTAHFEGYSDSLGVISDLEEEEIEVLPAPPSDMVSSIINEIDKIYPTETEGDKGQAD